MNPKKKKGLMLVHEGAFSEIATEIEDKFFLLQNSTDMSEQEIILTIAEELGMSEKDVHDVLFGVGTEDVIEEAADVNIQHLEEALKIAKSLSKELGRYFGGLDYVESYRFGDEDKGDETLAAQQLLQRVLEGELEDDIERQIAAPAGKAIDNMITFIEDEIQPAIYTIGQYNSYFYYGVLPRIKLIQSHLEKSSPETIEEKKVMMKENKQVNVVQDENGVYYFEAEERDLGEAIGRILRDREIKFTSKQEDGKFCIYLNAQDFNKDQQVTALAKKIKKDLDSKYAAMRYAEAAKEIDPDTFNSVKEIQDEIEERSEADEIDIVLDTLKRMEGDVSVEDMDEEYDSGNEDTEDEEDIETEDKEEE